MRPLLTTPHADSPKEPAPYRILVWIQTSGHKLSRARDEIEFLEMLGSSSPLEAVVDLVQDELWTTLPDKLAQFQPTVFHYIGHGTRGSIKGLAMGAAGIVEPININPKQFADVIGSRSTALVGVFLNGCQTAQWAPHLIPKNGWMIGTNRTIDDEVAANFSAEFYTKLIMEGRSPSTAYDEALARVEQHQHFTDGNIVMWVPDPDPNDFLHKVFSRQAFSTPTMQEGSLLDLNDALRDIQLALKTRGLATREAFGIGGKVFCRTPLDAKLVKPLCAKIRVVETDLRKLRNIFPEVVKYGDGWMSVPPEKWPQLLNLADRLDSSRNVVLKFVNQHLTTVKQLQMIELSSTRYS